MGMRSQTGSTSHFSRPWPQRGPATPDRLSSTWPTLTDGIRPSSPSREPRIIQAPPGFVVLRRARSAADGRALALVAGQHRLYEALVLTDVAVLLANDGRLDDARAAVQQCHAALREGEDWAGLLGREALAEAAISAAEGQTAAAQGLFRQAVGTLRHYHLPWDEAQALACWGTMLIEAGEAKQGNRRLDAAAILYRRHGAGARWLQRVARLRAGAHQGFAPDPLAEADGLTHREIEVLSLAAAGRSNQEIADALTLSVRTVERHLAHVYDKLGLAGNSARAGASAYGIAHGLVPATTV